MLSKGWRGDAKHLQGRLTKPGDVVVLRGTFTLCPTCILSAQERTEPGGQAPPTHEGDSCVAEGL